MLLAFKAPVPDPFSGEVSLNRSSYRPMYSHEFGFSGSSA